MLEGIKKLYLDTRKAHEPIWTKYLSRPFGAAMAYALRNTRVTPNQISMLALVVSFVGAAVVVGWRSHLGIVVAMLIYQLAYIIDCADGMLARVRGTSSKVGHLLDFLGDAIKAKFLLGAVALRLYLIEGDILYMYVGMGGVLLVSSAIALTTFMRRPAYTGETSEADDDAPEAKRTGIVSKILGLVMWGSKSLMNYPTYVVILAAFDAIEIYFWVYIGIYVIYTARASLQVLLKLGRFAPRG